MGRQLSDSGLRKAFITTFIRMLASVRDSQCQLLWSGISDRSANPLTIDVSGIESACILGVRMHDSNYPIIVCPVDKNGRFFGSAFHRTSNSNRYLFLSGRIDKDSVIFDAHLYDSYTIPELGYWPLRNAGDSLSVVEIYRLM